MKNHQTLGAVRARAHTHTRILLKDKKEKGSIAIYVIVSLIFLTIVLISMLAASKNSLITALKAQETIKNIYENDVASADQIYEKNKTQYYTIIYDSNGGTGTMDVSRFVKNKTSKLKANEFEKIGYEFDGWKDQNGNSYDNEAIIIPTDDLILTAQWKEKIITITYNSNGGQGTMTDSIFTINSVSNLKENSYTKLYYSFDVWKDQEGNSYEDKATITPTKDLVLTAQWKLIEYYVTLNFDGAIWYGAGGTDNYDTKLANTAKNASIKIYFNKDGFIKTEPETPILGPELRDYWRTSTQYNVGWRFNNATVTKDEKTINKRIQIPICIQGMMGWGTAGNTTVNHWDYVYDWNININISEDNSVSLSSSDSGVHRRTKLVEEWHPLH